MVVAPMACCGDMCFMEAEFKKCYFYRGTKLISLGLEFSDGIASPEINKGSGDIIYIDNRPEITRNSRQKEDVKIILEF